ncbi:hypothetical protein [Borreliella bavariensis]|uniref:hypothetical protein n=1 Tax=Borreliella bavariensis TaxID=664662 RepID=UPI001C000447|nr:hypothetical protein [Borreliella bavariensis]
MKKIFTLILIFSLTMQIFAQDKIEKDVGYIAAKMKYESKKTSAIIPVHFECRFNFRGALCPPPRGLYWW